MMNKQEKKRFGVGSLSLFIFIISVIFSYLKINKNSVGEHILEYFKLNLPESIITVILLILAFILGKKFNNHIFAKSGSVLSIILLSLFVIAITVGFIKMLLGLF